MYLYVGHFTHDATQYASPKHKHLNKKIKNNNKSLRPTDKSANVKERYKSVERSYGKGAQCTKQCKVGKMQRQHKRGHTFQCVFVGVYKRMYLYYSVYTIDYNYEISHILFFFVFLALLCISACQCVSTIGWFWRSHRDAILSLKLDALFLKLEDSLFGRVGGTEGVCPNASPQNQTKLDKIDKIRPNKCCWFFVCLCFCY